MGRQPKEPGLVALEARRGAWTRDRIVARAKELGETPTTLARKTGIQRATLSRIFSGDRWANGGHLRALAPALELQPENLEPPEGLDLARVAINAPPPEEERPQPSGLAGFLERHRSGLGITAREEWYLSHSRFRVEPWLVPDDGFWREMLHFWRHYLRRADTAKP